MSRQSSGQRWCSVVLFAVFVSLFLYYVVPGVGRRLGQDEMRPDEPERVEAAPADSVLREEQASFFARTAQRVRPAVVRIDAVHVPRTSDDAAGEPHDEQGSIQVARGCGLIVDRQGLVVTSRRVVAGAELVRIYLSKRNRALAAQVAGADAASDLAVLKFSPPADLPVATLAETGRLERGDCVMVVGNAYVPGEFICVGPVRGAGRHASPAALCRDDCISTSAANVWNVGGPLINLQGEVVGLATALSEVDELPGGLAVPAFTVRRVIDELRSRGRVDRGWLGVFVHKVELPDDEVAGARLAMAVDYVVPGSPASAAGIRAGDQIVRFGGMPFESAQEFRRRIAETRPGSEVAMTVIRTGAPSGARVMIEPTPLVAPALPGEREWGIRLLGAVTPEESKYHGLERAGVIVESTAPGRRAMGLAPRDVILTIDGIATPTLEDFCREATRVLESSADRTVSLEVLSEGQRKVVPIEPARR